MSTLFCSLVAVACLTAADGPESTGYLGTADQAAPYTPREGDLVFFDDHHLVWTVLFLWAGSGPPLHMGIVVKKADGSFALLEAGPDDTTTVTLQDLPTRLNQFHNDYHGEITIRRCKKELSAERSQALTKFSDAQVGKPYCVAWLLLQGTPLRLLFPAQTRLDRTSWICSELAVASGTVAGLMPPSVKANFTYPRDLVDNSKHDLSANWYDIGTWQARK